MRALKWAGPLLLAAEVVLVLTGGLSLGAAAAVFVAVELCLALVLGGQLVAAASRYWRGQAAGLVSR